MTKEPQSKSLTAEMPKLVTERTTETSRQALARGVDIKVTKRLIVELKPDSNNPRKHSKSQIRKLAKALIKFGFIVPVLLDKYDNVIAGHGRILAAQYNGDTEVPTICLDYLSAEEVRALRIADNRLSELSEWDEKLLAIELKELSDLNLNLVLDATGFEPAEIDLRIQGLEADSERSDSADILPEVMKGPTVTKPGDLWIFDGDHRLLCGDALDRATYTTLMEGDTAKLVIGDFPYNVKIGGHAGGLGAVQHREFPMASGEMTAPEFTEFLTTVIRNAVSCCVPGGVLFGFMDWRHMEEILSAIRATGCVLLNLCVWCKDNGGMGSLYRSQHELVFVFKTGNNQHQNNVQLGRYGRYRTNVWNYPGINSFARKTDEGNLGALHPTVKPVALVADAILDCSVRGDIILDPCMGSGTSLIAAVRTGRKCYGLELDPIYVDTIIRRWQAFTGGQARHAASGKTFDELAAEVANGH